jgi:hypothetical protein
MPQQLDQVYIALSLLWIIPAPAVRRGPEKICIQTEGFVYSYNAEFRNAESRFSLVWLFMFKVTEPSSIPYRTHPGAPNPDPPSVNHCTDFLNATMVD